MSLRLLMLFIDALAWQASENVGWSYILSTKGTTETAQFQKLAFDWDPGFKIGVGAEADRWDTKLYYTRFLTHATASADAGPTGFLVSAFMGNKTSEVGDYRTGNIKLNLRFNMLDWELGSSIAAGTKLTLRPMIGVKGGRIAQTLLTNWQNPNFFGIGALLNSTENICNNFWGVGPKAGVDINWKLGTWRSSTWNIFGDFAGAFMFGGWTVLDRYNNNLGTTINVIVPKRKFAATMVQSLMGIEGKFGELLAIKAGYEIQDWFNQYQVFDDGTGSHTNDLVLQGLTVRVRYEF